MHPTQLIAKVGGVSALAAMLGLDHSSVSKWKKRDRLPVDRIPDISRITGIPRHELRPDLWEAPVQPGEAA